MLSKTFKLIVNQKKNIRIPKTLQTHIEECYHNVLFHPGETRTELTLKQHLTWPNIHKDKVCSEHVTCALTKRSNKRKYALLPEKKAESKP